MAVKIKLKRMGKIRVPQYRIIVADARTRRDGRAIEELGKYHPKEQPSMIDVDSERVQYWLGVGAQPTEPVLQLLKITGDWQRFKGLPGGEGRLQVAPAKADKTELFNTALAEAHGEPEAAAATPKKTAKKTAAKQADRQADKAGGETAKPAKKSAAKKTTAKKAAKKAEASPADGSGDGAGDGAGEPASES